MTIIDAFEAVGACARGLMNRADVDAIERAICPGEGACGGMYTANTMASAAEALGMSLPGSAAPPATDRRRDGFARRSGAAVVELLRRGITARDILTSEAFDNAIAVVMAFGGSTNAVLHLLAIAHESEVDLTLDDFAAIGAKVPHLADVKPFGRHVMQDVDRIGGVPVIMKALLDAGLLHGDCLTVTGRTLAENLADIAPARSRRQGAARDELPDPPDRRHHDPARVARAGRGGGEDRPASTSPCSRARRGCSSASAPRWTRSRTARSPPATSSASATRARRAGRACARCSRSPARSRAPGWARTSCCSPTDASPAAPPACASATSPPRQSTADPIAFVRDGDRITLDVAARTLDLHVDAAELERRKQDWQPLPPRYTRGVLAKYTKLVGSASTGAVCG